MTEPLLDVENLHTQFDTRDGAVNAVNGLSFTVDDGEIVGIVGESGSGKSVSALSLVRLEDPGRITDGSVRFEGTEMTEADDRTVRRVRGRGMSMVFQDPMSTLNPVFTVRDQIVESLKVHESPDDQRLLDYLDVPLFGSRDDRKRKRRQAIELMDEVGIPHPEERVDAHPHEFSGGMRQRAMLAIALARKPDLLVADEPTTALDVTIQAQILERLRELNEDHGMAVLLITHDLGVVAELCDRVLVMYGGEIMERGPTDEVLHDPQHPYTRALLECMPQTVPRQQPLNVVEGEVPDMLGGVEGCPFAPRCEFATPECTSGEVRSRDLGGERAAACCHLDRIPRDQPGQVEEP